MKNKAVLIVSRRNASHRPPYTRGLLRTVPVPFEPPLGAFGRAGLERADLVVTINGKRFGDDRYKWWELGMGSSRDDSDHREEKGNGGVLGGGVKSGKENRRGGVLSGSSDKGGGSGGKESQVMNFLACFFFPQESCPVLFSSVLLGGYPSFSVVSIFIFYFCI